MLENLSLSLQGIWSHKLRSVLTMLGIIIGIASIITIVATIQGTNEQIKENLIGAGTNAVTVRLYQDDYAYSFMYSSVPDGVLPIREETRQQLAEIDHVEGASLFCQREYADGVYYQNRAFSGQVFGVDEEYFSVCGYRVCAGRGFAASDFADFRKVAIVDETAASSLFAGESPVGKTIELMGEAFTVVGEVSGSKTGEAEIETLSDYYMYADTGGGTVFLPLSAWPILYRFDEPQCVALKADSTDNMTKIGQKAASILTESQLQNADKSFSYRSSDLTEQAEQLQSLATSSNRQLLWIASISLLVGGIGVMNIMLVTVTERTREIGLKKAVGAKRRHILRQFLTEAAVLTSLGGIIGVLAGIGLSRLISSVMGTPTILSLPAALIAVVFSMLIGIVFGLLPAAKAAKLNPIDALRRE